MEWPEQFYAWRRGEDCPMCAEGRLEETRFGIRILADRPVAATARLRNGRLRCVRVLLRAA